MSSPVSMTTRDSLSLYHSLDLRILSRCQDLRNPDSSLLTSVFPWFKTPVVLPDFYASARTIATSLVNPT